AQAFTIALITIVLVIAFLIGLSYWSLANRPRAQRFLVAVTEPGRGVFLNWMRSRMSKQNVFTEKDISEFHWTNGLPPTEDESPEWLQHRDTDWSDWRLELGGELNGETKPSSLDDLTAMSRHEYIGIHSCMQGWTATSKWAGVKLRDVLDLLGPRPENANYVRIESPGLAQGMYANRPRAPFCAVSRRREAYEARPRA